jgi:hypothetical protein
MKDQAFIDMGTANDAVTEENMRQAYELEVKIAFIEKANRNVCVPLKTSSSTTSFASLNLKSKVSHTECVGSHVIMCTLQSIFTPNYF